MISTDRYEIILTRHAFIQADRRGITADMIEATLKGGKVYHFGKKNVRFVKRYKQMTVICVDEIVGDKISIVTIERR
mgnify:CR=1 FL=1